MVQVSGPLIVPAPESVDFKTFIGLLDQRTALYVDPSSDCDETRNQVSEIGASNAHFKHCDVAKEEDLAAVVDFAKEKFGKLDIMFNNARIPTQQDETFETLDLEAYDRSTAVMSRGVLAGIKHASRVMIPIKQGLILNMVSTISLMSASVFPIVYNISKGMLPPITKVAAYHLGKHGIRVNAISPHLIIRPVLLSYLKSVGNYSAEDVEELYIEQSTLAGKRCMESDAAKGALFLCSEDSSYMSGQNMVVDGGWCNSKELYVTPDSYPF